MAHFAKIDDNGTVLEVVVINNEILMTENQEESEIKGIEFCQSLFNGGQWIQTSYNARIRKHYAGIGFHYDKDLDAFIPPSPYPSWILNESSCTWEPPIPMPIASENHYVAWNEATVSWIEIAIGE